MNLQGRIETGEAAKLSGYTPYTLCRYARDKTIPAVKVGRVWYFRLKDILAYKGSKPQRVPYIEQANRKPRGVTSHE